MTDLLAVPPAQGIATSVPRPVRTEPLGFLPLSTLQGHPLFMDAGPTGASRYWSEWFAFVHPEMATTDVSLNLVDEVWLSRPGQRMWIMLPDAPQITSIAETVREIRDASGLPATDVAAMFGVKRRRLYDLLDGESPSAERERWIHVLAGLIRNLAEAASGETGRVRAALLHPGVDGLSLFDLAIARDEVAARERTTIMCSELRQGQVSGRVQRPSPTLKRLGGSSAASDFLSGYRERDGERA
jgi:tetrahydromethanopterin S-methyltransferase subunit F